MWILKKLKIISEDKFNNILKERVDEALTTFRKNMEFEKRTDISEGDIYESLMENDLYAVENMRTKKIDWKVAVPKRYQGEFNVSEAVQHIIEEAFATNPWSIRTQDPGDLFAMQDAAVAKYMTDPHARNIANNMQYYTVGSGLQFKVPDDKVRKVIREFKELNQVDKRCKSMSLMTYLEGEYLLALFNDSKGNILLRRIPSSEIIEIETHPEDIDTIFSFYQEALLIGKKPLSRWIKSWEYSDYLKMGFDTVKSEHEKVFASNVQIQFIKYGIEGETRGRVPFQPIMKYLKYYEDFVLDRVRLNHERAKVVWIKEVKGRSPEAQVKDRRSPRGGIILIENENVKYRIESAKLDSTEAEKDALLILYTIASGVNIPIYILDQRSDQQNYSSIKKSDTPFSQMIMDNQDFWFIEWEKTIRALLELKVEKKLLPLTTKVKGYLIEAQVEAAQKINELVLEGNDKQKIIKEATAILKKGEVEEEVNTVDIPIDIVFPDVIQEDALQQAQVLQIHNIIGIASRSTLSSKAGYNWPLELSKIKIEQQEIIPPEILGQQDGRAVKPRQPVPKNQADKKQPLPEPTKPIARLNR